MNLSSSHSQPANIGERSACKLGPKENGNVRAICKHCGCRMQFQDGEADKACTACKCGKKNKECKMDAH